MLVTIISYLNVGESFNQLDVDLDLNREGGEAGLCWFGCKLTYLTGVRFLKM